MGQLDTEGMDLQPALVAVYGDVPHGAQLTRLMGDASTRSYYRLHAPGADPDRLIVMRLPDDALASDEGGGGPAPEQLPFLDVQQLLQRRGIPVPRVWHADEARGLVLLEDLGDETFNQRLQHTPRTAWEPLYERAVDLLVELHAGCADGAPEESIAFRRHFDRSLLRWELDHFREWGLQAAGHPLSAAARRQLDGHFDALTERLLTLPRGFVHRDYQSRNLMFAPGDRLVVIDFQDALRGPRAYDLAALLCDSYVHLELPEQRRLVQRYARAAGVDLGGFERDFWTVVAHRKLKDAGRFVFIDQVRANPGFLPSYAPSLVQVGRAVRQVPELGPLGALLAQLVEGFPDRVPTPAARTGRAQPGVK